MNFKLKTDNELIKSTYDSIVHKDKIEVIVDRKAIAPFVSEIMSLLTLSPQEGTFCLQALLKLNFPNGSFYTAQCLLIYDNVNVSQFGGGQSISYIHEFKLIGIANMSINLGTTVMRPKTIADIIDHFLHTEINFEGSKRFNKKYYLVSDKKKMVLQYFNSEFINAIAKYDDILLTTNNDRIYLMFNSKIAAYQGHAIEEIFSNCKFLA